MINVDAVFVDTNILIYATDPRSPFQQAAFDRLEAARRQGIELIISPQILREYLAAATRAASRGGATSLTDALSNFRTFRAAFTVLADSPAVLDVLDSLVGRIAVAGKQVHDANIVATSDPHDAQLASGLVPARQYLLSSSTVGHIA